MIENTLQQGTVDAIGTNPERSTRQTVILEKEAEQNGYYNFLMEKSDAIYLIIYIINEAACLIIYIIYAFWVDKESYFWEWKW